MQQIHPTVLYTAIGDGFCRGSLTRIINPWHPSAVGQSDRKALMFLCAQLTLAFGDGRKAGPIFGSATGRGRPVYQPESLVFYSI